MTKWLFVPREKLELIIDIGDFISYFSLIFSFENSGRKIKKVKALNENDEYLQSCFFFSPLSSCFLDTLLPLFFLRKNKIKRVLYILIMCLETEIKV